MRPPARLAALAAVLAMLLLGTAGTGATQPTPQARATTSNQALQLDGTPWWPAGFNAPQLSTRWSVNFGCGAQVDLDQYFAALPPRSLTRVNLFQALSVNKSTGKLDFTASDAVFDAARRHNQMLLPVLAPQDGACDDEQFKERAWYASSWKKTTLIPGRSVMSFQKWITTAVNRYKANPVVAGWTVVGEPETSVCSDDSCLARTCPKDAAKVLRAFMDATGAQIHELDQQRLVFTGFLGGGQCGTAGEDYAYVGASRYLDVLEYHDYGADGVALPGDVYNGLATRIRQARALGKPLVVAEIGEKAGSCKSLTERRDNIAAKIAGQRRAGTAGALLWASVPDPRESSCTYDIGPDDPLHGTIAALVSGG